jgi:NTE family protein
MSYQASSALVLQGGGALGAYELGAARALYADKTFAPDLIAGVSIGAITAVLLARPAKGLKRPLEALEAFWEKVAIRAEAFPPPLRQYASLFGDDKFFVPRLDYFALPSWTYIYETEPLRRTLEQLVDTDALSDPKATPRLLVSATDLEEGQIEYFYSGKDGLSLDHIIASGSLPPSFPKTDIKNKSYWDGGLFDNTPLGAVLDKLNDAPGVDRTVYVVNLFPNKGPVPRNLLEVMARIQNLQFANKTAEDLKMMCRFDQVAALMEALENFPGGNPLADNDAYKAVKAQGYVLVPNIIPITRPQQVGEWDPADFSPETIKKRADEGRAQTEQALREHASRPRVDLCTRLLKSGAV